MGIEVDKKELESWFEGCADVSQHELEFELETGHIKIVLVFIDHLCDTDKLDDEVVPGLEETFRRSTFLTVSRRLQSWRLRYLLKQPADMDEAVGAVFGGQLLLLVEKAGLYMIDISNPPQRSPEEPNTEITIRGPRDGFTEQIGVNAALIRKRIRSNQLRYETFTLGERSKTTVGLFYMDDLIEPGTLDEIRTKLRKLQSEKYDGLFNTNQLEEWLAEKKLDFFPKYKYTGLPDFAARSLTRGRFVLMVDGTPTVLIAPVTLTFLMRTSEDHEMMYVFASVEQLLRLLGAVIAIFLPGFWVGIISFHPEQLPFTLLASLAQMRLGVPLPVALEALVMLFVFELFREAGTRLPGSIGQVLSIVGGLIIGDAAIRAGLTNPAMVVVIATAAVSTYVLVHQSLTGTVSILRVFSVLLSSMLGIFGFYLSVFIIVTYICNLRTYGVPYLSPLVPIRFHDLPNAVFRPWAQSMGSMINFRPSEKRNQGRRKKT